MLAVHEAQLQRPCVRLRVEIERLSERPVREHDLVDRDVAPASALLVDDLEECRLARESTHVEGLDVHRVVVPARRRARDGSVDDQVHARAALVIAAADPEVHEVALDRERAARQRARVCVGLSDVLAMSSVVRVHDAQAVTQHFALVGGHLAALDRAIAEGSSRRGPADVGRRFEVVEENLWSWILSDVERGTRRARANQDRGRQLGGNRFSIRPERHVPAGRIIAPRVEAGSAAFSTDRVLDPTRNRHVDGLRARVGDAIGQHRGGQSRVALVERNERRERLEIDVDLRVRVAVLDERDRILTAEPDVVEARAIELPHRFSARALHAQREALLERRARLRGMRVQHARSVQPLARLRRVEDVPVPQLPVAAEVELSGADAADRHADPVELLLRRAVGRRLAAREERLDPGGIEVLVRWNEMLTGPRRGRARCARRAPV